jgi:hypothetical protein
VSKLLVSMVFLVVLAAVTVGSAVEVASGDPDWLSWLLLVVGPLGVAAAAGEFRDALRERR